jgi:hypothetical protein
MTRISISTPGFVRSLWLDAAAVVALSAVPIERAAAMSPINPGIAPSAQSTTDGLAIQVRGGHGGGGGGHFGGGGGHFGGGHIGGGHIGGGHFGAGGWHGGGGWHGARVGHFGGYHYGGFHRGYRFAHFHHRRFYGGYYPYYYPYYHHHCRIVWTYYGPRRVCWHRHWHHWRHYY